MGEQNCQSDKYIGEVVGVEIALICGDRYPTENEWLSAGPLRTKSASWDWDTVDFSEGQEKGNRRDNRVSYQNFTFSGEALAKARDSIRSNQIALKLHILKPSSNTGSKPVGWLRLTYPDVTIVEYVIFNSASLESPYDDAATFSFESMGTASTPGPDIYPTEDVDCCN